MFKEQLLESAKHVLDNITVTYILLALLGQLLHIVARLKVLLDNKLKFSFRIWVVNNLLDSAYSGIAMIVLLLVFAGTGQLNSSMAFMLGYCTDNLIKRLIETASATAGISTTTTHISATVTTDTVNPIPSDQNPPNPPTNV